MLKFFLQTKSAIKFYNFLSWIKCTEKRKDNHNLYFKLLAVKDSENLNCIDSFFLTLDL